MRASWAVLLVIVALATGVEGSHCETQVEPEPATPTGHYLDNRLCQPGCKADADLWEESNGIAGLQTDADVIWSHGGVRADTLLLRVHA